jgi:hypothetical protein
VISRYLTSICSSCEHGVRLPDGGLLIAGRWGAKRLHAGIEHMSQKEKGPVARTFAHLHPPCHPLGGPLPRPDCTGGGRQEKPRGSPGGSLGLRRPGMRVRPASTVR